jgi:hypothetical protein
MLGLSLMNKSMLIRLDTLSIENVFRLYVW